MLTVKSSPVELRGIVNKTSKNNGSVYYLINTETADGSPHQFFAFDAKVFADGLKKGDMVSLTFRLERWQREDKLFVEKVEKVER